MDQKYLPLPTLTVFWQIHLTSFFFLPYYLAPSDANYEVVTGSTILFLPAISRLLWHTGILLFAFL